MIELKNISLEIDDKTILKDINLTFSDNKTTVITGPNGSGKSTLMKVIMGIQNPTSGQVLFNGEDITKLSVSERANLQISYAMQQPVKFKGITVKDLLLTSLKASEKTQEKNGEQIEEIGTNEQINNTLSLVGLCPREYLLREVGNSLSGGELKRIEIASVIIRKSKFIIFDEPEAGIDIWSFNRLTTLFKDLSERLGCAVLIVSHQERIIDIADEIVVISNGEVKIKGTKSEVLPKLKDINNAGIKKCKRLKNSQG